MKRFIDTKENYLKQIKEIAINKTGICQSNKYINSDTKLKFKCNNHIWFAQPRKIKRGDWCPECSRHKKKKY